MGATRRTLATRVGMILAATVLALPAFAGAAIASPPSPPNFSAQCEQFAAEFRRILAEISSLQTEFPDPPQPIADLIAQLQARGEELNEQLSSQFCSSFPSGSSGGSSASNTPNNTGFPSTYGSGHRYYDRYDTTAPVIATQVGGIPSGGVATGDGSFGE